MHVLVAPSRHYFFFLFGLIPLFFLAGGLNFFLQMLQILTAMTTFNMLIVNGFGVVPLVRVKLKIQMIVSAHLNRIDDRNILLKTRDFVKFFGVRLVF